MLVWVADGVFSRLFHGAALDVGFGQHGPQQSQNRMVLDDSETAQKKILDSEFMARCDSRTSFFAVVGTRDEVAGFRTQPFEIFT